MVYLRATGTVQMIQPESEVIYVAGDFDRINGIAAPGMLALDPETAEVDPNFDVGMFPATPSSEALDGDFARDAPS